MLCKNNTRQGCTLHDGIAPRQILRPVAEWGAFMSHDWGAAWECREAFPRIQRNENEQREDGGLCWLRPIERADEGCVKINERLDRFLC